LLRNISKDREGIKRLFKAIATKLAGHCQDDASAADARLDVAGNEEAVCCSATLLLFNF
jgi:hypothetical protein